jgi:hypothetical protein
MQFGWRQEEKERDEFFDQIENPNDMITMYSASVVQHFLVAQNSHWCHHCSVHWTTNTMLNICNDQQE